MTAAATLLVLLVLAGCGSSSPNSRQTGSSPGFSQPQARATARGCAPPGSPPRFIAVILQGIGSSSPGSNGQFDPASASFCASPDGQMPPDNPQQALRSLADGWLNYSLDKATGLYDKTNQSTMKAGDNLINKLANAGGYVLPFSYEPGTKMSGTINRPAFTAAPYTSDNVGSTDPVTTGPSVLQDEIKSIHSVFEHVPIIIVGHSNGGLIAEQWWLTYGSHDAEGVVQVFALDSPLNGVAAGSVCATGICTGAVGPIVGAVYRALWAGQDTYDPIALKVDAKDHLFTAVADLGDPLYDVADYPASHFLTGVKNIGLVSQLYWTEPSCAQSGYDLSSNACTATGRAIMNPCGHNLDDGRGPDFGTPFDLWLHSLVKNCSGTIQAVLHYAAGAPSPPAQPPANTRPPPTTTTEAPCAGHPCGTTNGVTVVITSVTRSPTNFYGEDLTPNRQFFVRMGVRIIDQADQPITIDNSHFALQDSAHIVDMTSDEGYGSKCGLTGNGDPGMTLSKGADVTMPESLCFEPHGSVRSPFIVALGLDTGGEVDVSVP